MQREEWLKWRRTGVTGTDVAAIMGLSPYGDVATVWDDKHGLPPARKVDKKVFHRGNTLEPIVAGIYQEQTSRELVKGFPVTSEVDEWRIGTPDYFDQNHGEIIEIKVFNSFFWNQIRKTEEEYRIDSLPIYTHCQGQWYTDISQYDSVRYILFNCDAWDYIDIHTPIDKEFCSAMKDKAEEFWFNVVPGERPASLFSPYMPGDDVDEEMFFIPENNKLWRETLRQYCLVKEREKAIKTEVDEQKLRLHQLMGNKIKAAGFGLKINFKPHKRKSFMSKKFEADHPDLHKKYTGSTEVRPLRITGEFVE